MKEIKWEGDLNDDCTARHNGYIARCECMGEHKAFDEEFDSDETWKAEEWWFSVSRESDGEDVFNTADVGGTVSSGDLARALCEALIKEPPHV